MASEALALKPEFAWVIFGQIAMAFTLQYLGGQVMAARKKYKVDYPKMYAEGDSAEAKAFNCVQRGHQNALETYATMVFFTALGGLKHPIAAAFFSLLWSIGRILYMKGYSTGNPNSRYSKGGSILWIGFLGSLVISVSVALSLLKVL